MPSSSKKSKTKRDQFIEEYTPMIKSVIEEVLKRYSVPKERVDDLLSEAVSALMDTVADYSPTEDGPFKQFANQKIYSKVKQVASEFSTCIELEETEPKSGSKTSYFSSKTSNDSTEIYVAHPSWQRCAADSVIALVDDALFYAAKVDAKIIEFKVMENEVKVNISKGKDSTNLFNVSKEKFAAICSRFKVMAGLNITSTASCNGNFDISIDGRLIHVQVAINTKSKVAISITLD